jgi:hypothetical protein
MSCGGSQTLSVFFLSGITRLAGVHCWTNVLSIRGVGREKSTRQLRSISLLLIKQLLAFMRLGLEEKKTMKKTVLPTCEAKLSDN